MRTLAVVGRGSAGALAVLYFLKETDWNIKWYFDSTIPPTSVGEATNLSVPSLLARTIGMNHDALLEMGGHVKQGIWKKYWGNNSDFLHPFPVLSAAMHFTSKGLHEYLFNYVKDNPRIQVIEQHVDDPEELDADHVLVCNGTPKNIDEEFIIKDSVPVNAVYVTQCHWNHPQFSYSLTHAMKHGWVFGIPLQKRASIGYMYNSDYATLDEIKEEVKKIFEDYDLVPSEETTHMTFQSRIRRNNFGPKVVYNGNASFFLEPLEATSLGFTININRLAKDLWLDRRTLKSCQKEYEAELEGIEAMIMMHYMSGSIYDTPFWKDTQQKATEYIENHYKQKTKWAKFVTDTILNRKTEILEIGTWPSLNYTINLENLHLMDSFKELIYKHYPKEYYEDRK